MNEYEVKVCISTSEMININELIDYIKFKIEPKTEIYMDNIFIQNEGCGIIENVSVY